MNLPPPISWIHNGTYTSGQGLQNLNETRVAKMNLMWSLAAQLEKSSLSNSTEHIGNLLVEIPRNNPHLDSLMFLQHNVTQSQEPANLGFEPSPVWHDDASIVADEAAKVFLRNVLSKSKTQIRELRVESDRKKREVEGSKKVRENIQQGKDNRNELDVVRSIFYTQESLHEVDRKWVTAEVETATIMAVAGDLSLGAQNHNFRTQTFKIPTNCDLCGERIWGLSAKGFDCRDCGYTCHSKCQMKVPAECPGEQTKEDKKKLKVLRQEQAGAMPVVDVGTPTASTAAPSLTRQNTMNSLSSGYAASTARSVSNVATQPTPESPAEEPLAPVAETKPAAAAAAAKRNRVLAPPPTAYVTAPPPSDSGMASRSKEPRDKMLYAYQATGSDEVSVEDGDEVVILQPDGTSYCLIVYIQYLLTITQMVLDGCVCDLEPTKDLFRPRMSKLPQHHLPCHLLVPVCLSDLGQRTQTPRHPWREVLRRNVSGRLSHPDEERRNCNMSRHCTSTKPAAIWSGIWQRVTDLSSSTGIVVMDGPMWNGVVLRRAFRRTTSRRCRLGRLCSTHWPSYIFLSG